MKKFYLLLITFGLFYSVNAQIINIPNANFKAKLLAASPSNYIAFGTNSQYIKIDANSNGQIEVSEALMVQRLDVGSSFINSLVGIEYFTNLTFLDCNTNTLSALDVSALVNLTELDCSSNNITSLNVDSLVNLYELDCSYNNLTTLNINGLDNLHDVAAEWNQTMNSFYISNCSSVYSVNLLGCALTSFGGSDCPALHDIDVRQNQLTTLDLTGFSAVWYLDCGNNALTTLILGDSDYINLSAFGNQLSSIEWGADRIFNLNCSDNLFTAIDWSGFKGTLNCSNNNLISLNVKNGSFIAPQFTGNPNLTYICADEAGSEMVNILSQIASENLVNCHVNTYCSFVPGGEFYTMTGNARVDADLNGCSATDPGFANMKYKVTTGSQTTYHYGGSAGSHFIPLPALNYSVTPILENPSYFMVSPATVSLPFQTTPVSLLKDFCLVPQGNHQDLEISIIPLNAARPGFDADYKLLYRNKGNVTMSGTITLQYEEPKVDFVSSSPFPASQASGLLTFNYSDLAPVQTGEILFTMNVNTPMETPPVNNGDELNFGVTIGPTAGDEVPFDNSFGLKQTVVGSFDPNDITCLEGVTVGPELVGQYVHYLIRFENTGTYAAENVVVMSLIDQTKFNLASLIPIDASHSFITRMTNNKVEFIFENIDLPFEDATNDGYILFKIKTVPTLTIGQSFSGAASIYFDFNYPIVTNTATTTIELLNIEQPDFSSFIKIYPNPANDQLNISMPAGNEIRAITIFDALGRSVLEASQDQIDISDLSPGTYFLKIDSFFGPAIRQFVKK